MSKGYANQRKQVVTTKADHVLLVWIVENWVKVDIWKNSKFEEKKITIWKKLKILQKNENLTKNRKFDEKLKFWKSWNFDEKLKIWQKVENLT